MFKPSGPWEWHPDRVAPELRNIAHSTICLLPLWQDADNYAFDYAARNVWTGAGGGGARYKSAASGICMAQDTNTNEYLDSGQDILGGLTECTVTAVVNLQSPSTDDNNALSSNWNSQSVCLWRNESRTAGTMRVLLDCASGTADTTMATGMDNSTVNVMSFRYDGTTLEQFLNGAKDANSSTAGGGAIDLLTAGNYYRIGRGGGSDRAWTGDYYMLHVANRALGDDEIAVLHSRAFDLLRLHDDAPIFAFGPAGVSGQTAALSAGVDASSTFAAASGATGGLTASASVTAALSGNAVAQGNWAASINLSSTVGAIATAMAALSAAVGAGESWAALAAAQASLVGSVEGAAQLVGQATSVADLSAGAGLDESMTTGSEFSGALTAGASATAAWVGQPAIQAAMSAGTNLSAAFLGAAQAAADFTAGVTAADIAGAVAQAVVDLSANVDFSDTVTATVSLFGVDGVLFAEVTITPATRASVGLAPSASTTVQITPATRGRFTIN